MLPSASHDSPLLTVPEVSERLRVSTYTVRRLVRAGEIPALRVGQQLRVSQRELEEWLFEDPPGLSRRTTQTSHDEEVG